MNTFCYRQQFVAYVCSEADNGVKLRI